MITRVTTSVASTRLLANIQTAGRDLSDLQNQLTTGRRITKMSDAPSDAVSAMTQRAGLRRNDQFSRNIGQANDWLGLQDSALSSVNDKLTSIRTLLIQARSADQNASSRAAIAAEISSLREALISDANTQRLGRPLFGGTTGGPAAYDATGAYVGDTGSVAFPVSANTSMTVSNNGPAVFGDMFDVLDSLATAVRSGDTTAMAAGLGQIDVATDRVAVAQVSIGARVQHLDGIKAANQDADVTLKGSISDLEDVDLAESLVALKTREAGYQAALQATAQVVQLSLMDFLR